MSPCGMTRPQWAKLSCWFFRKHKNIFAFSFISQHWLLMHWWVASPGHQQPHVGYTCACLPWVGGGFCKVVATFSHVGGSFNLFITTTWGGCLNNPIFSNLALFASCWAHVMCHHKLCSTSMSHLFSLNTSWGLTGGNYYQKDTILTILRLVLQNFAIPGCFPYILFYRYLFSLLSSGWFVIAVCGSISVRELVKY